MSEKAFEEIVTTGTAAETTAAIEMIRQKYREGMEYPEMTPVSRAIAVGASYAFACGLWGGALATLVGERDRLRTELANLKAFKAGPWNRPLPESMPEGTYTHMRDREDGEK